LIIITKLMLQGFRILNPQHKPTVDHLSCLSGRLFNNAFLLQDCQAIDHMDA
jgi:hypothetical protein